MSDLTPDHWPLAPADRMVVRVRCRVVDAELAADRLFAFGASAVGEQPLAPEAGGAAPGTDASLHDWVELTADVAPALVDEVLAALPGATGDVPPADPRITIGHRGALDLLDFQLDPARLALNRLQGLAPIRGLR